MTRLGRYWGTRRAYDHAANVASICVGWTLGDALRGHSVIPLVVAVVAFAWNTAGYFCLLNDGNGDA